MNTITQYINITNIDNSKAEYPNRISSKTNQIQLQICFERGVYYLYAIPVEVSKISGENLIGMTVGAWVYERIHEAKRNTAKQRAIATTIATDKAMAVLEKCKEKYGIDYEVPDSFFPDAEK